MVLSDVRDFQLQEDALFYHTAGRQVYSTKITDLQPGQIPQVENSFGFGKQAEHLFAYTSDDTYFLQAGNALPVRNTFIVGRENGKALCRIIAGNEKKLALVHEADTGHIIWQLDFYTTIFFAGSNLYVVKFTEQLEKLDLLCINKTDGTVIWHYVVPEKHSYKEMLGSEHKGEIQRIIGEYKGILWIALNSGALVGLDVKTGNEKYQVVKPDSWQNEDENNKEYYIGLSSVIDTSAGRLFGISGHYYWQVDLSLDKPRFDLYNIQETLDATGIKNADTPGYEVPYSGKYILFYHARIKDFDSAIAVFNRETKQVVWCSITGLPERPYFGDIRKLDINGSKIYILETAGNLYIFDIDLP